MSLDTNALVRAVKQTAVEAVNAGKPCAICFGKVISASPLQIQVDQKLILSSVQLVLTSAVSTFSVPVTVNHYTGYTEVQGEDHRHSVSGQKTVTVHLGLAAGEQVILLRADGGQKYIVLDRVRGGSL